MENIILIVMLNYFLFYWIIKERINSSAKKTIKDKLIDFETIKKLILSFYPKEDDYFFNLILSPITNTNNFFQGLEQFYKNIKGLRLEARQILAVEQ